MADLLPLLLPFLEKNGVKSDSITIVVALGTHGGMSEEQLRAKIGEKIVSRYRIVQHDAWAADLVPAATLRSGRSVKINSVVAAADLRVSLGSVLPHPMAGFGGSPKIIMPGVADFESIKEHHTQYVAHPRSTLGCLRDNLFHGECMSVTRQVGVDFSFNCLYDSENRMIDIVGGAIDSSYFEGVKRSLSRLGFHFEERMDVTITSTVPHVHGTQMLKALSAAGAVTREGGAILFFAPVVEPLTPAFADAFREIWALSNGRPLDYIVETFGKGENLLPGRPMDFAMAVFDTFSRAQKAKVVLVSPMIKREEAALFGFGYAASINEGINELSCLYPKAKVGIFPSGGLVVPLFKDIGEDCRLP